MQNIIVEKEEDAKEIIKFLEDKKAGKATFLPLSKFRYSEGINASESSKSNSKSNLNSNLNLNSEYENYKKEIISKLKKIGVDILKQIYFPKEIIKVNEKYLGIISVFLDKTLIVENIDIAIAVTKSIKGMKVVTLNGDLFASTGSITGGYSKKVANILGRKEEITKLEKEIISLERKSEEIIKEFENKKTEYILKEREYSNILNDIYEEKLKIAVKEKEINGLREKGEETLEKINNINVEIENITVQSKKILENKEKIEEIKEKLIQELEKMHEERVKLKENLDDEDTSNKIEELADDIMNVKISIASFEESENSIAEILERITSEENELLERKKKKNKELSEYQEENVSLEQKIEKNTGDITKIEEENVEIKELQNKIRKEKEEKQNIIRLLNKKIEENDKKIEVNIPIKLSKEQEMFKIELEEENYVENMWNEYQVTLNNIDISEYEEYYIEKGLQSRDIEGNLMEFDIIKAKKRVRDLKSSIKDLGEVDTSIIKEYLNTKERYDYLLGQREDLESSKKSLEKIIKEIAFAMEEQFVSRMDIINKNFKEILVTLFGGGNAKIEIEDKKDPLNSGIAIKVEPPGKKLQNMMLLSGGERAFTAIAILFAILKLNPSPFCVLDEIEAALDDVNVARVARYLKTYSEDTQFLIITHRKGTMESSKILYGVTMEENGVSKLVSLDMRDKK